MKRRSDVLIKMRILEELREEPRGPTRLAQAINLAYDKFVPFLQSLEARGLVRKEDRDGREVYVITQDGIDIFLGWEKIWEKIKS